MIKIENMSKSFDSPVLEKLNLEIEDGSIFGLIGINGAGKTTLLNVLAGILKPEEGSVTFDGEEVFENVEVKKNIFLLPDDPYYQRNTTPTSLVALYKSFYKVNEDAYYSYLKSFRIPFTKSMYNFSKGMRRQVFAALALAIEPKYLFLDEAFDGLDPLARITLKKELLKVQEKNNMTVIISSHSLRELEDICDSYGLLDGKKIQASGDISDDIHGYHKYQVAFKVRPNTEELKNLGFMSIKQESRFATFVTKDEYSVLEGKISYMEPVAIDELPIDFEELFVILVEMRGYIK